jgi:hypothetical protein
MNSRIKRIIMKIFNDNSIKIFTNSLGRWSIDYRHSVINRKIDLANIDNCGICYDAKAGHPSTKKEVMK